MLNRTGEEGFTLVETIVAFGVLGASLLVLFTLYGVLIVGNTRAEVLLDQGLELCSIADELKGRFEAVAPKDTVEAALLAEGVFRRHPDFAFVVKASEALPGLYEIRVAHKNQRGEGDVHYLKVYSRYE